jgi:ADP-dependent NAD(P)H-hydrate dehydratase / NAD(P)H-hydrate epimerase
VLAGWIAGLWAQAGDADAHAMAVQAAFRHGLAAEDGVVAPLRASELIERMHALG